MAIALNRSRQVPADETPAFAGIAERFRRAGDLERAVALCRDGLKKFPDHLSARVTLGWSLLDLGRYDEAQVELEQVLKRAPDNLAAIRGLAELHERAENAVVVPMEEHEAAEAAAALEAARALENEKAPPAPAEPPKRAKAQAPPPASEPEPAPAKTKEETRRAPEPPRAAATHKHQSAGPSVFSERMLSQGPAKTEPKAEPPAPKAAAVEVKSAAVESKAPKVEPKPEPPSLEALAAEFEASAEPLSAEPPKPEPTPVIEPVRVLDNRGQEVPDVTRAAATAETKAAAAASVPNLVDELVTPAAAAMAPPAGVVDDFIPPPSAAASVPEPVIDDGPLIEIPVVDFSADADALLSSDALLSAATAEPAANTQIHTDVESIDSASDVASASMLGTEHPAMASAAHPEPDVNELLAQLAQEEDSAAQAQPMLAAEEFVAAPELHPEPQIAEVIAPTPAAPAESFESEPAWQPDAADFIAALEATHIERVAPPEPEPAGPAFALSAEPPAPVVADDFALKSEPVAAIEAAATQPSMLEDVHPEPSAPAPKIGTAQVLNFEAPPPPPPAPAPVVPQRTIIEPSVFAKPAVTQAPPAPVPVAKVVPPPVEPPSVFASVTPAPVPTPVTPAPVAAPVAPVPKAGSALLKKKNRNVAALEKMLRKIAARRLELASEYQPS